MPSKLGFGNSRTPITKKVGYGSAMHYKNPIKRAEGTTEQKLAAVKGYKEHGDKPGYKQYLNKVMGGKTKVKGMTTTTTKKK
tara:strand:- start:248 stop:493 length:246 start_codon:yes stop_codon:yes gene_type:complete